MGFPQRRDPSVAHVVDLVRRALSDVVRGRFVGLYPFGSLAFGAYVAAVSDVDLIAVVSEPPSRLDRDEIVSRVAPKPAIGLPTRGLDLLVVTSEVAQHPPRIPTSVLAASFHPNNHWEPDVVHNETGDPTPHMAAATVRQTERFVAGPSPQFLFGPVPRAYVLEALTRELDWWLAQDHIEALRTPVLNACRAWYYVEEHELVSKEAGGKWAMGHLGHDQLIAAALAAQRGAKHNGNGQSEVKSLLFAAHRHLAQAQ